MVKEKNNQNLLYHFGGMPVFLTVAVPVYNAERFLDICLKSIFSQRFEDYEVLLVDDGSTDRSLQICYKWKRKYPMRVRVIAKENSGSLLTRRICLKEAKGQFIYIMDADDYLLCDDLFSSVQKIITNNNCDLVFFNATSDHNNSKYYDYPFVNQEVFEKNSLNNLYKVFIEGDSLNSLWNKVFSRELVDWNVDYSKYKKVTNGTDWFQTIPILFNAKKIVYLDLNAYYYRLSNNSNSIVHSFKPSIYYSLKCGFLRMKKYFGEFCKENELQEALRSRALNIISTSVYKVRLLPNNTDKTAYRYIKMIGEDNFFRLNYSNKAMRYLPLSRRLILLLLHRKKYKVLLYLIRLYSFISR